ncbi:MAG: nucleoside hydrolase [Pirellulales bacterium]
MARKVIIDADPGIDDALAICLALASRDIEVVAITATGGNVPPEQATRNVQAVIEQLDPPRWPRIGAALAEQILPVDGREIHGTDGLGGARFKVAELHHRHPSDKVICDEVRAAPEEVTIVALGPLTNIAAALQRDPGLATLVGHLIVMGGAVTAPGNVTPCAEFNIFCDAEAARAVFRSHATKTLIPLDVTGRIVMTYDQLDKLPGEESRTGGLLRRILPFAFRSHRQHLGLEGIHVHDAVAMVAAIAPDLFRSEEMVGDVETTGDLTRGQTVFDRRRVPYGRPNMEVALDVDAAAVMDQILTVLKRAP